MVDSGAVNLPPLQCWMTIPNCFTALQHANRSAGCNGFPPSHTHTPARRPWKVTLPLTPCLARAFSWVMSTQLLHHWGAVWCPTLSLEVVGSLSSLCLNIAVCPSPKAWLPLYGIAALCTYSPCAAWSASLTQLNCHHLLHRCAGNTEPGLWYHHL